MDLFVKDALAGLEKLPTDKDQKDHYRKHNLSCHVLLQL
jgi:hypothetical protein